MTAAEHDFHTVAFPASPAAEPARGVSDAQRTLVAQDIATSLAHELRNPVFAIASAARLLRYRIVDDPVMEKNIGRILREAERLNGLVDGLLEYGRPAPVRLGAGDPDDLWNDVLQAERGALEAKALIVRHTASSPHATCEIDGEQLAQAFAHLLANAVDAAPEASDLTLTSSITSGEWRCELRNGGEPIPAETLSRAFDLLVSNKPGHAGIGLALARRIVTDHGGTIALASSTEHGTVATVVLPLVSTRARG
jgi:two-component system sensor histidine kinase HydH